ncbi:MAG: patatin-like phospholipase family protein, partial [Burkholderiales bacterium]|nr:patatin-like phospholipase family protein [Burkholderiales bacterium]
MRQSGARRVPRAGFARRLAAFVLTLAAAGSTVAAAAAEGAADRGSAPDSPDAKTCLVLSGGGARGLAHVGVLERIEALRIPIRCIVGTSMGAVVGALYASGMNAQAIASLLTHADWAGLSKDSVEREDLGSNRKRDDYAYPLGLDIGVRDGQLRLSSGLLNGQRFELMLRRWLGADDRSIDFDHLPIPFRAVAADIETGRAVVMSRGRLVDAVRASMAVPGLFSPVERDGATLIDGGVAENLPVDVALAMGAQHVIAVDVSTPPARRDELRNPVQVFQQMVSFLTSQNVKTQIALLRPQDLLITPDLKGLDFQAFESAPEFIARGLAAADRADDALRPLGTDATRYAAYRRRLARPATAAPIVLAAIEVEPQPHVPDSAIRAIAGLEPGVALDAPA